MNTLLRTYLHSRTTISLDSTPRSQLAGIKEINKISKYHKIPLKQILGFILYLGLISKICVFPNV